METLLRSVSTAKEGASTISVKQGSGKPSEGRMEALGA